MEDAVKAARSTNEKLMSPNVLWTRVVAKYRLDVSDPLPVTAGRLEDPGVHLLQCATGEREHLPQAHPRATSHHTGGLSSKKGAFSCTPGSSAPPPTTSLLSSTLDHEILVVYPVRCGLVYS